MDKKILCQNYPNLYPRDYDLNRRWFLKFYAKGLHNARVVFISSKYKDIDSRLDEAARITTLYKDQGYSCTSVYEYAPPVEKSVCEKLVKKIENNPLLKSKSKIDYISHVRSLDIFLQEKKYKVLSTTVLNEYYLYLKQSRKLENTTVNNHRRTFITLLGKRVGGDFKKLKSSTTPKPYFSDAEKERIKTYIIEHCPRMILPCALVYWTAIRTGNELRQLRVMDVDLNLQKIQIRADSAKNNTTEFITIPPQLLPLLESLNLEKYNPNWYLLGLDAKPAPKMVGRDHWSKNFTRVLKDMNFDKRGLKYSMYCLKNSFAVEAWKNDYDIKDLQYHFRHKNLSTTDIYLSSLGLDKRQNFSRLKGF